VRATPPPWGGISACREVNTDKTDIVTGELFTAERTDRFEAGQRLFYDLVAARGA
jgi:hypothetical protein